ncbi:uncharacterized protein LOC133294382 [Gastrolobium bilobum]|uniref:uncharacterized protein LOC133294382 n=1 Tax=Gastrolobium bilobum TaxID=150636 RepID=UPI002AB2298F|nr:uncharacterized protein LOC133294382 [Gastrolobium bilobum]
MEISAIGEPSAEEVDLLKRSTDKAKEVLGKKPISYKDTLLQLNGLKVTDDVEERDWFEELDVHGMEEDVQSNDQDDPFCPTYRFSKELYKESCRPWKQAVIIKLLGKKVGVKFLLNRLLKMWNLSGTHEFIDMENDYFLFRFADLNDYNFVLEEGPWIVADHYVSVQRWRPLFDPYEDNLKKLAVWIRIPGLPMEFYTSQHLRNIGDLFGKTLKIDRNSIRKSDAGDGVVTERAKFARICVEVDLSKGFLSKFNLINKVYTVGYEGLHMICFACGKYGHRRDTCSSVSVSTDSHSHQKDVRAEVVNNGVRREMAEGEAFGSWMIVQRSQRGRKAKATMETAAINAAAINATAINAAGNQG